MFRPWLFPEEAEMPLLIPPEDPSKPSMRINPNNQTTTAPKTEDFPSNSRAPDLVKDEFIPGLFTKKAKLSKRAKRAWKAKAVRLLAEVTFSLYELIILQFVKTNQPGAGAGALTTHI